MRILVALTYYRPHVSGLTVYADRLARGLARRGHTVRVLTSRFHPALPPREQVAGVEVLRVPVALKVSKGVVMPWFPVYALYATRGMDVVNVHLPQFEAALLAACGRWRGARVVLTYHCDLRLPAGFVNGVVRMSLGPLNDLAGRLAHRIVATTADYAHHSPFLRRHAARLAVIPPLVELPPPDPAVTERVRVRWGLGREPRIGFAARFAAEKGVEYLLRALPALLREFPDLRILFTGAWRDTVGEEAYLERLTPLLRRYADHLRFLELVPDDEMPAFFALCDALAVTSLNSTEAFGLVQVEAMLAGTPVVATDLPGVREAVRRTGMGEIVPPRDPEALAAALVRVIRNRPQYVRSRAEIEAAFDPDAALAAYEAVFGGKAGA